MSWNQKRRTPADYVHPKKKTRVLTTHAGICHLCGHPDATGLDHVIPWAEWNNPTLSVHDESNLRPAHDAPCPHCQRTCHDDKTKAEAARGVRRYAAAQAAKKKRPDEKHPGAL